MMAVQDPRDELMLGRAIKTTGMTVLRGDPSKGKTGGCANAGVVESSLLMDGV